MAQKDIELTGIIRNIPDNRVADGAVQELINLRPRDGALRPVGVKSSIVSVPQDVRFIHKVTDEIKVFIGTNNGVLSYWIEENGVLGSEVVTTVPSTGDMNFASLHRSMMVGNNTTNTTVVFVFDMDTKLYRIFEGGLPELPDMNVESVDNHYLILNPVYASATDGLSASTAMKEVALAEGLRMRAENADRVCCGPVLIRFAWEMADGSIVKHSIPVYTSTSYFAAWVHYLFPANRPDVALVGKDIEIASTTSQSDLAAIYAKWKGVISSLNIYMCRPQEMVAGVEDFNWDINPDARHYVPTFKEPSLADEINYYLMYSIPISSFAASSIAAFALPGSFNEVETRPTMEVDNFSHHTIHGTAMFAYNSRIFLGNTKTTLYKGFPLMDSLLPVTDGTTGTSYDVGVEFDIETEDGTKTVFSGWQTTTLYGAGGTNPSFQLPKYFGYPDSRAKMCRVYVRAAGIIRLVGTMKMTSNQVLNFSTVATNPYIYAGPHTTYAVATLSSGVSDSYSDYNRVQATELSNPFSFPAKNSYRIGLGVVLGLSSNAIALSTGQFGQFPIYCFTTDGIWTMNMGSGELLINTVTPLSREVCNNPGTITQVDGGVVFNTSKGLMVLSGPTVSEISELAEGSYLGRISGTLHYEAIANNPNLYMIKDYLCATGFLSYISGAVIGWDYILKEIIVSNTSYKYSWVYSLRYKTWFKISQVWDRFVGDFPVMYGYRTKITTTNVKYNDWFLPSKEELYKMYTELHLYELGGFDIAIIYWSSSELYANSAWVLPFADGNQNNQSTKEDTFANIRACRAFTTTAVYNLRDIGPAGGYIFHIIENGGGSFTYYEAAPAQYEVRQVWSNIKSTLIGSTSINIGEGQNNTIKIMAQTGFTGGAAKFCNDLEVTVSSYASTYLRHNLTEEEFADLIPVHLETRPLKLAGQTYKKINRILVAGYINSNLESPFSVNLFGSPDGREWYLLNNGTTFGSKKPLLIGRSTFSCKLFILVIGGKVDEEAYFTHIEADFEERYANKLR